MLVVLEDRVSDVVLLDDVLETVSDEDDDVDVVVSEVDVVVSDVLDELDDESLLVLVTAVEVAVVEVVLLEVEEGGSDVEVLDEPVVDVPVSLLEVVEDAVVEVVEDDAVVVLVEEPVEELEWLVLGEAVRVTVTVTVGARLADEEDSCAGPTEMGTVEVVLPWPSLTAKRTVACSALP